MAAGDLEKFFMGWLNDPTVGEKLANGEFEEALSLLNIPATEEVKQALKNLNYNDLKELSVAMGGSSAAN